MTSPRTRRRARPISPARRAVRRQLFRRLAVLESTPLDRESLRFSPTFVVGPPRAGTTLVRQLIAWGLSTCYFTNLVAGTCAWLGYPLPLVGGTIVRWLHGPLPTDRRYRARPFTSRYGQIDGRAAPAEGEVLWGRLFGNRYGPVQPEDLSPARIRAIRRAVIATEQVFAVPFINKTSTLSLRIRAIVRVFPSALFIHVKRDPWDTAQSILVARRSAYPKWLGARPPECQPLVGKDIGDQVCEQVFHVERNIARERAMVGGHRFLSVSYRDACLDPRAELQRIRAFMRRNGAPVRPVRAVPEAFPFSHGCKVELPEYRALQSRLAQLERMGRVATS